MKVSVIIPVYNVERFVLRCIESIIDQTMTEEVECIIVDDCTPDKSMEIIQQRLADYHGKIQFKIINHERNRGLAVVRNTGIDNAKGDYIIHIDSDDWCESDMLEKMYQKAVEEDADVVVADYYLSYDKKEYRIFQPKAPTKEEYMRWIISEKVYAFVWNRLVRRSLILDHEIRNFEGLNYWEDYYFSVRVTFFANRIAYLSEAFVHYIQYNTNSLTCHISKNQLENKITVINLLNKFLQNNAVFETYKREIQHIQLTIKFNLLRHSSGRLQKEWNLLYKGSTSYIITHPNLGVKKKILLLLASCKMLFLFNAARKLFSNKNEYYVE